MRMGRKSKVVSGSYQILRKSLPAPSSTSSLIVIIVDVIVILSQGG